MIITKELKIFNEDTGYTPHEHILDFIDPSIFEELLKSFPSDSLFFDEFPETRKLNQRPHKRRFMCYYETSIYSYFKKYLVFFKELPKLWQELSNILMHGKEYKEWICETFKISSYNTRLDWHRTSNGLDVSPHIDSEGKEGSHLFYFMPRGWKEEYGGRTTFYKEKTTPKMNPEPYNFKKNISYPVIGNRSLLFKNSKEGWHGVTQVDNNVGLHRQLFNVVILKG